jgi:hypothetical protein
MTPPPLPDRYLCMANGRARAESTVKTLTAVACAPALEVAPPVQTSPPQAPKTDGAARVLLDPTASPEVSGEYPYEPSTSVPFGVAFARSRRRAFLAGCGAGASGAMVLVGAVVLVTSWSAPRSENRGATPTVTFASRAEQASTPLAAATAAFGGDRAAPQVPRPVRRAPRVVAAPVLVEERVAAPPTAVGLEASGRPGDEEGEGSAASDDRPEPKQLAKAEDGAASDDAAPQAQPPYEPGPALGEREAAATEAEARAGEASEEPDRVALVPAVEPEQPAAADGEPGAPADEVRGQ